MQRFWGVPGFLTIIMSVAASLTVKAAVEKAPFTITEISSKTVEDGGALLKIKIKDAEKQTGVCPYYVEAFTFNKDKKELNLKITKGFCPNDQFGVSQGDLYWVAPRVVQGEKLCIYLNNNKMGSILVQGNKKTYRVAETCE